MPHCINITTLDHPPASDPSLFVRFSFPQNNKEITANAEDGQTAAGYLHKLGEGKGAGWKQRWFCLQESNLSWHKGPRGDCKGLVHLAGYQLRESKPLGRKHPHQLELYVFVLLW